jgi:hypothetical protein
LTSLDFLKLEFKSTQSRPNRASQHSPPLTRSVLPALTRFIFKGVSEYLEKLVARFDAPKLNFLQITFIGRIVFGAPHFIQFISRTPKSNSIKGALVNFGDDGAKVKLSSISSRINEYGEFNVKFSSSALDRQISSLARVCTSSLPPFSTLEDLYIDRFKNIYWLDDFENRDVPWLELLRPFGSVKNLYISEQFALHIVPALQELGSRATEVLPTLQNIFLEGLKPSGRIREGIRQFVATRQVTSHPLVISCWVRRWDDDKDECKDEYEHEDEDEYEDEYEYEDEDGHEDVYEYEDEDDDDG